MHPDKWRDNAVKNPTRSDQADWHWVFGSAKKELLNNQQYATFVETTTFLNDVPMEVGKEWGYKQPQMSLVSACWSRMGDGIIRRSVAGTMGR